MSVDVLIKLPVLLNCLVNGHWLILSQITEFTTVRCRLFERLLTVIPVIPMLSRKSYFCRVQSYNIIRNYNMIRNNSVDQAY